MKYIAAPYASALNKEERMDIVTRYSALQMKDEQFVICPLTMGHNFARYAKLPEESEWWLEWCLSLLSKCSEMDVLMLPGWKTSVGVQAEIRYAKDNNIKINYKSFINLKIGKEPPL